jgi:hypothetical protein
MVERLRDEIVRARLDRGRLFGASLAVSMITGNIAVSSCSRSRMQTA